MKKCILILSLILVVLSYTGCPEFLGINENHIPEWTSQPSVNTEGYGQVTVIEGNAEAIPAPSINYYYAKKGSLIPENNNFNNSISWSSITPNQSESIGAGEYILYGKAENSEGSVLSNRIDFIINSYFTINYHNNGGNGNIDSQSIKEGDQGVLHDGTGFAGDLIRDGIRQRVSGWSDLEGGNVITNATGSQISPTSDLDFYAVYTTVSELGEVLGMIGPAGGLIAYDAGKQESWGRYIEAAPSDLVLNSSNSLLWGGVGIDIDSLPNNTGIPPLNTTQLTEDIGNGKDFTALITEHHGNGDYAAKLCQDYVLGDYSDWFLPSIGELDQLYQNLFLNSMGGFTFSIDAPEDAIYLGYLSSTEQDAINIWQMIFIFTDSPNEQAGEAHGVRKDEGYSVRPCRYVDSLLPANSIPVADAGPDQNIVFGNTIQLDGSNSSDIEEDALTYTWSIISWPEGSTTTLSDLGIVDPTFTPDIVGEYVIQLYVNDGSEDSNTDSVTILVTQDPASIPLQIVHVTSTGGYTVDVEFNKEVDETTATDISNYEIAYWVYELFVSNAELDTSGKIVTLTTSNSQGQGNNNYDLTVSKVQDLYENSLLDTANSMSFVGTIPVGIADFGHDDNYIIKGQVRDNNDNPVKDYTIPLWNSGKDNIQGIYWGINDDIEIKVISDNEGNYEIKGLPSQPGITMDSSGGYDLSIWFHDVYEPYSLGFNVNNFGSPYNRTIVLYDIVQDTKIEGSILDNSNTPLPNDFGGDLIQICRGDVCIWAHCIGDDPDGFGYYNTDTGDYHIKGFLGGGLYSFHYGHTGYTSSNIELNVDPGQTKTQDIILYKLTSNNMLPIYMTSPVKNITPTHPINFSWEDTDHNDIKSYVLGIWSASNVSTSDDNPAPQGQPDMLYYIMQEDVTSVEIDTNTSPMTISGDLYRQITNVKLTSGEIYYWGVFAFNTNYNDADENGSFSGEPSEGLWSFTAP